MSKKQLKPTEGQLALSDPVKNSRTKKEHIARYQFAKQHIRQKNVLDIACGTGYGTKMLREYGARSVTGVDCSQEMIAYAQEHHQKDGVTYLVGDAQSYSPRESFDVVVSFETIEHVADYQRTLKNFYYALRPGGRLILSTPNRSVSSPYNASYTDTPDNPFHIHEFEIGEIAHEIVRAGFRNIQLFSQVKPPKFNNRILQKFNRIYQKFSHHYSPEVRPLSSVTVKYVIVVAEKGLYPECY